MELLLNELSLTGQFISVDEFVEKALPRIFEVFKSLNAEDEIFKTYNFYDCKVTSKESIHNILMGQQARMYDEIRRFKIYLSNLFENPYWEDAPKHNFQDTYNLGKHSVSSTSLAEACERDLMIISFLHNDFINDKIKINKNQQYVELYNLKEGSNFLEACKSEKKIDFSDYCSKKFANDSKLNFDNLDQKNGFSLILSESDENLFLAGFEKFNQLSWQQISIDDGLDYKEYENKGFYSHIKIKKHKFRISQKYRCFGYVENGVFNVLCFDLTHKLSD